MHPPQLAMPFPHVHAHGRPVRRIEGIDLPYGGGMVGEAFAAARAQHREGMLRAREDMVNMQRRMLAIREQALRDPPLNQLPAAAARAEHALRMAINGRDEFVPPVVGANGALHYDVHHALGQLHLRGVGRIGVAAGALPVAAPVALRALPPVPVAGRRVARPRGQRRR